MSVEEEEVMLDQFRVTNKFITNVKNLNFKLKIVQVQTFFKVKIAKSNKMPD